MRNSHSATRATAVSIAPTADSPNLKSSAAAAAALAAAPIATEADLGEGVVPAGAGDHLAIHRCLLSVFQAPEKNAFLSSLDDPFYEPRNRLLVRGEGCVAAHVHLTQRTMHIGLTRAPVAGVEWLGTLPEYRRRGYARRLLAAADRRMRRDGAVLGMLNTSLPKFFQSAGWTAVARRHAWRAGVHDLLAELSGREAPAAGAVDVRPWRQIELPALMRLHQFRAERTVGAWQRTEPYWRWLLSCNRFDRVLLAVENPRLAAERSEEIWPEIVRAPEDDESWRAPAVDAEGGYAVGYVVLHEDRILEMATAPGRAHVAEQLLARACREAIDANIQHIAIESSSHEPLAEVFERANRRRPVSFAEPQEVCMVKLLDPLGMLRLLCPELDRRAAQARIRRPDELGIAPPRAASADFPACRLAMSRRSIKLGSRGAGRRFIRCESGELTRMMLGRIDIEEAFARSKLQASARRAIELAADLFPKLPWWRPALDVSH